MAGRLFKKVKRKAATRDATITTTPTANAEEARAERRARMGANATRLAPRSTLLG